jgi:exocyst complex component 2
VGTSKADQVYAPLLENRKKAERLRSTLGVFERSKFFFNLPGTLIEDIEAVSALISSFSPALFIAV